jgi:nicotinamidase/pyrazinamidase
MATITQLPPGVFPMPALTPKEAAVQKKIDELNNTDYSKIQAKWGDLKPKHIPTLEDKPQGGNLDPARRHYARGTGRSLNAYAAKSYGLCVLTTLPALPKKIAFFVEHLFSRVPEKKAMLARDIRDLKDATKFITAGTVFGLGHGVLTLLADPFILFFRFLDQKVINKGDRAAMLLIDPQLDFFPAADITIDGKTHRYPGGTLPVAGAWEIVPVINKLMSVFTGTEIDGCADNHPVNHGATAKMLGVPCTNPPVVTTLDGRVQAAWPIHCVNGSRGQRYVYGLVMDRIKRIFTKGEDMRVDSYSAFYDNGHINKTLLAEHLKARGITHLYIAGVALDYCVAYSAMDAADEGFKTFVVEDACRGVDHPTAVPGKNNNQLMKEEMQKKGVTIVQSADLIGKNQFFKG